MEVDKGIGKVVTYKGVTYWLHTKHVEKRPWLKPMWFSKVAENAISIPDNMEVIVNMKTGLPCVRNIKGVKE